MKELGNLDMAVSNHDTREDWLEILAKSASQTVNDWHHSHISMKWVIIRCICITQIHVKDEKCVKVCDSTLEAIGTNVVRPVSCDDMVTTREIIIWNGSKHLK